MKCTPVFERNFDSKAKIVVNRGGTRSSKTYSIAQLCAFWLVTGKLSETQNIPKGVWTTVRKYRTNLDGTVIRDFEEILHGEGWYNLIDHNKTKKTYKYKDRLVEFIGADDEQKLRGAKRNILYCNEANELSYKAEFFQLLMRTEDKVFIDFNPDDEDIWINTELEQKRALDKGDVEVIVSNYKHNSFLPKSLVEEIEYLKDTDPEFFTIYGLGEYGKISGLVYNVNVVDKIPENAKKVATGLDFGFSSDPTVVVDVYRHDRDLYFDEVLYSTGLTNHDIADILKEKGYTMQDEIICDSAEPKSIEELYRQRINARATKKGKDSIHFGIMTLKSFNLNVTEKSLSLRKEFRSYKWMVDKTGNSLNKPVDKFNHGMDAIRYVALMHLTERAKGIYSII